MTDANVPNVSLKDTKETIFKAFQVAQADLKALQSWKVDIKAEVNAQAQAAVVDAASKLTIDDVENQIISLKRSTVSLLDDMDNEFTGAVKTFKDVQLAILAQEAKLQELFGIEDAAFALVALVNAKEATATEYDTKAKGRTAEAQAQLTALQNQISEAQTQYSRDINTQKQADQQARDRAKAEWDYEFNRNKKSAQDTLADELVAKRRVFNVEIEAERNALAKDTDVVVAREATVIAREKSIDDLQAKVNGIPDAIDVAVKSAEGKLSGILSNGYKKDKELLDAQNSAQNAIKDNQITTLQDQLNKAQDEIATLRDQVTKATENVKDMALKSIESSSDSKLAASLSRTVSELSANKQQK